MPASLRTLVFLLIAMPATADAGVAGWTDPAAVIALEAGDQGRFLVQLDVAKNASGCRDPNWFYVDYGRDGHALMYQTFLDAYIHERRLKVYVTGVCDLKGYSAVSAVRLQR